MADKKKLVGVYLPFSLIAKLKKYIAELYIRKGVTKSQSEVVEEAVGKYLDDKNQPT